MLKDIDLEKIVDIAQEAGKAIMEIYKKDFTVEYKDDKSPLTEADTKANEIICSALEKLYPSIPMMSEENQEVDFEIRKNWEYYWCIDPIDGTKEFIKKNDEFTINIALIHKNTPVLGVVFAPAIDDMYSSKKGSGAFKNGQKLPLKINKTPTKTITIVASKSHLTEETKAFIDNVTSNIKNPIFISKGSSLKLVMVAEGSADIYPRLAPTMEWDTAAGSAIVLNAGFDLTKDDGKTALMYNKENLLNPHFIVKPKGFEV